MNVLNMKLNKLEDLNSYGYYIMDKENSLDNNIKNILDKKGLNQSDLSKLTGISRQNISDIIQNKLKPGVDFALKIAVVLNTSVEEIFALNDTAWYKIAKLDDDSTLFVDLYELKIIDNKERKKQIEDKDLEYYLIKENKCISEVEYKKLLNKYISNQIESGNKITKKEIVATFDDKICTKRYKKLAQKIYPLVNI